MISTIRAQFNQKILHGSPSAVPYVDHTDNSEGVCSEVICRFFFQIFQYPGRAARAIPCARISAILLYQKMHMGLKRVRFYAFYKHTDPSVNF